MTHTKAEQSKMPKAPKGNGARTKITSPSPEEGERDWQAQDDMRLMAQAKEIEDDPVRMQNLGRKRDEEISRLQRIPAIKVEVAKRTIPAVKSR
jgi:hypothetical protein